MPEPVAEPDLNVIGLAGAAEILGVKKSNTRSTLARAGLYPQEFPSGPMWNLALVRALAESRAADTKSREADEKRRVSALRNASEAS
jgi:hypothetical protein